MNPLESWPENLYELMFHGDGHAIYFHLQESAKLCMIDLAEALKNEEIPEYRRSEIDSLINLELQEADRTRVSLNTVDNRILREKQNNHLLKHHIQEQIKKNRKDNNDLLYELLDENRENILPLELYRVAEILRPDVNQSLRYRIQFNLCWDTILSEHRKMSVSRVIHLGHALTEAAIVLQDAQATEQVRQILSALDIKMPHEKQNFTLPPSTSELRKFLSNGVRNLDRIHLHVLRLDHQRRSLHGTRQALGRQLGTTEPAPPPVPPRPEVAPNPTPPGTRMTYHSSKKNREE